MKDINIEIKSTYVNLFDTMGRPVQVMIDLTLPYLNEIVNVKNNETRLSHAYIETN